MSNATPPQRLPRTNRSRSRFAAPPERSEAMRSSRSCLALLLSVIFLAGLAGCGPASSDKPPNLESRASVGGPASRGTGQEGKTGITPIPSGNETGSASGKAPFPGGDNIGQGDKLAKSSGTPNVEPDGRDKLPVPGIPESVAKALDSPDARERLQAMNHWETKGTKAPLDPLFAALDDEDGYVRAKATEIIERYWAAEQERNRK